MKLTGEYQIPAPRERVWGLLNDPDVLRECMPGCEMLETTEEGGFKARVTTKIGPVKATFNGAVELTNINAPQSYRIEGEGQGGVAGFAKGHADVNLAEEEGGTRLSYEADVQVGGKLAQLGNRLVGSTAKKLADQFFSCFAEKAGGKAVAEAAAAPAGLPGETVPPQATGVPEVEPQVAAAEGEKREEEKHESAFAHAAHELEHAAEEAEEAVEERAASGFLGGPVMWGLLVLLAMIVVWALTT
ncbi:SRPBCC family protein [Afifella pfennigii]|uniref:SRPBCC family protein n=1 Tax=Afifella pfennigii TaxID=209897 RepID=UPI00047AFD40|nr:carbon monoxide dehydrogenase subunit G [Afifella pfennigii]